MLNRNIHLRLLVSPDELQLVGCVRPERPGSREYVDGGEGRDSAQRLQTQRLVTRQTAEAQRLLEASCFICHLPGHLYLWYLDTQFIFYMNMIVE